MIKAAVIAFLLICGFTFKPIADISKPTRAFEDTIPSLHALQSKDIVWVNHSSREETITVALKSGITYTYAPEDWDLEDSFPSTDGRIVAAIKDMEKIFTQVEHPPAFPGGEEAWNMYIRGFCMQHAKEIRKRGPVEVIVQFIVHMKGQLVDIQVISNPDRSKLSALAVEAIRNGPPWIPAVQNGRVVVSFQRQVVRLNLE